MIVVKNEAQRFSDFLTCPEHDQTSAQVWEGSRRGESDGARQVTGRSWRAARMHEMVISQWKGNFYIKN